jgi:ABC-2 type transport system ATP-binding protein
MSLLVSGLTKVYGSQKAVDNLSFSVKMGEIVGFLGPNGAGKSTTLRILAAYLPPTAGKVEVNGFDVVTQSLKVRQSLGYLPEHNPLYPEMYVREFLHFAGSLHGLKGRNLRQCTAEMIEQTGLAAEQNKRIGTLSKGYRQRVGLAAALIHNPPVLMLDEPTTGLDPNQIVEIRHLIKTVGRNKTVIFSSHLMQEVEAVCSRVIILHQGKLVADQPIHGLQNAESEGINLIAEFADSIDPAWLQAIEGVVQVAETGKNTYLIASRSGVDVRAAVFRAANENQCILLGLKQQEAGLESIFQSLTKK